MGALKIETHSPSVCNAAQTTWQISTKLGITDVHYIFSSILDFI
jgi:hypothetical protein